MSLRACPDCGERRFQRVHREGLWERWFLPLYGLYPWTCRNCGRKMYRFKERPVERAESEEA